MKESDKTEETLEDLLAEENKRLINYGVQPVLAAFFTFLFFLFMGLLLFLSGMSWFSLFPPVLGAAVSVLLYFLLKNYLFFQMLSLDMFGLLLSHEKSCSLRLDELKAHADLLVTAQKRIIALLHTEKEEDDFEEIYDDAMKERMRKRLNVIIERLEKEKKVD